MNCPTPEKQVHRSQRAALKARDSLECDRGIDLGLKPYRCGGHWHLGHQHKRNWLEKRYSTRGNS